MNKGQSKPLIVVILFLFLIVAIFLFYAGSQQKSTVTGNVISDLSQQNCQEVQVPYDYVEEYQETVPYTAQKCETKNLVYSVTNEKWNTPACNQWSKKCDDKFLGIPTHCTDFCTDKTLSYSLDINNLDEEQGSWTVNINFYKQGTTYKTYPVTQSLYPKTTKTFTAVLKVTGDSPSGDANQEFSADYSLKNIPTKQVCRDITDYKEVTKTRTVTKYRTETKCD
ncbi:MAG: hypothetical protein KKD18_06415 [Nanoarchaeota archaeon]|nr:hypothetical protein [Nanoarchaeota archaeon]MBU0978026.1 hypothetical protein [Nanoarchaeota archaeon]